MAAKEDYVSMDFIVDEDFVIADVMFKVIDWGARYDEDKLANVYPEEYSLLKDIRVHDAEICQQVLDEHLDYGWLDSPALKKIVILKKA